MALRDFSTVCAASLPAPLPPALSALRTVAGLRIRADGDRLWLRWEPGAPAVALRLLTFSGVELYERRGEHWYRMGRRLPASGLPLDGSMPDFARAVTPGPIAPEPAGSAPLRPAPLTLAPGARFRPASALLCTTAALESWADRAPTAEIEALRGAAADERVLVLGQVLPAIPEATRLWGGRLLVPLGLCPTPELDEAVLRSALGLADGELGVWTPDGCEAVPDDVIRPLTRAGIRLLHPLGGPWTP